MITNLLAQGPQYQQIEPRANALMRAQQMQDAQLRNALMRQQMQNAQAEMAQRAQQNALMQQAQEGRSRFLNDQAGNMGPPQAFNPAAAMAAGLKPEEVKALMPAKPQLMNVAPGGSVYDPAAGRVAYSAPFKPEAPKLPDGMRIGANGQPEWIPGYLEGRGQVARQGATSVSFGSPVPVQLPDGSIGYVQPSNRGGPVAPMMTPEGKPLTKPTDAKEKDLTEGQAKATTFLGQMRSASQTLQGLGMDQSALSMQAETALAGGSANIAIREKAQQVRQAQDQWSEAYLRFKTGAAATDQEVENNRRTFFPKLGDKPETVAQKKAMRAQAEKDMEISAGRGAKQLGTQATQAPAAPASAVKWSDLK